jgi:hypothetical protein
VKGKLLALALLAGGTIFAGPRVAIGVQIGSPYGYYEPPVAVYDSPDYAYVPPCPGPGYSWVDGYWYFSGPRRLWRAGYWAAPVYAPRYGGYGYGYGYRGSYGHGFRDGGYYRGDGYRRDGYRREYRGDDHRGRGRWNR